MQPSAGAGTRDSTVFHAMTCRNERRYDVVLTRSLFDPERSPLPQVLAARRALVVMTPTVAQLYGESMRRLLGERGYPAAFLVIPGGEAAKTVETTLEVCAAARRAGLGRRDVLVAFGGGICCDVVTLAATLVRRGIPYITVPTTLVGQIDAGLALKGGVNFDGAKNYLGCFTPPQAVVIDPGLIRTLAAREVRCGLAEIAKIALVRDAALFERLVRDFGPLGRPAKLLSEALPEVVVRAARLTLEELEPNSYEDRTLQRILDFGHTFSPTLEEQTRYLLRHGEAVAVDMSVCAAIAATAGLLDERVATLIVTALAGLGLPTWHPSLTAALLAQAADAAEAHRDGQLNLVLPTAVGSTTFLVERRELTPALLDVALRWLGAFGPRVGADRAVEDEVSVHVPVGPEVDHHQANGVGGGVGEPVDATRRVDQHVARLGGDGRIAVKVLGAPGDHDVNLLVGAVPVQPDGGSGGNDNEVDEGEYGATRPPQGSRRGNGAYAVVRHDVGEGGGAERKVSADAHPASDGSPASTSTRDSMPPAAGRRVGDGENAWRHRAPETRYVRVIKPALDHVLALLLGIVLAPLIAAVSLAVLVRLGRPVIFAQARVGRAGELFTLYKFRSMTPDRRIGQLPYQWAERRLSYEATDDPRHTRLGLFLRTWSLDELPQLWNVFIGDMSLIGPRPEVPQVVAGYTERQHARHRVRPGMTGLWQVTCRAAKPMHAHVELDLDYVERVSPGLDASILLKTVPVVVGGSRRWFGGLADPSDDADPVS